MPFQIQPATLANAPEIGKMLQSVSNSPRIKQEFKDCTEEAWLEWNVKAVEAEIGACGGSKGEAEALVVVEGEGGEIVGYAVWGWGFETSLSITRAKDAVRLPEGCNTALRRSFLATLYKMEAENQPQSPFYELLELATSPKFQRRGIGSQLINYGLEKAKQDKVKVYLSAAPGGVPVYRKLGLEEVGRLEVNLEGFGAEGVHVHVAMVKEPLE
ncbi:acyl-CoA N-acyltransferase [Mollisia scopiformis]|uniref:Acyl-CoA N-acyltransferase n=1 Tax=Mollisia scopiformis TaxID=149040 RepID=A0A132B491_MOLSC|nr:acyl-CoA N-acyltransferase [Mollisia scopiformis]KUJ07053.1 acyl-CoA N-acyltransferase [Mollisia scopiformis]